MQDKNNNSSVSNQIEKISNSIVNLFNTICASFKLSEREALVQKQWLQNIEYSKDLASQQKLIDLATHEMPVLLTSSSKLAILEAILVIRARDGHSTDDIVAAIEAVRCNIIELDIANNKSSNESNLKAKSSTEKDIVKHEHHYSIPIVNEIGYLISDFRSFVLLVGLMSVGFFLFLSITKPRLCDAWENRNGIYENQSLYCQMLTKFSQFFENYQQVK